MVEEEDLTVFFEDGEDELESDEEKRPGTSKLAKPSGDAGRPARGGYTLREAAGLSHDEYDDMKVCFPLFVAM